MRQTHSRGRIIISNAEREIAPAASRAKKAASSWGRRLARGSHSKTDRPRVAIIMDYGARAPSARAVQGAPYRRFASRPLFPRSRTAVLAAVRQVGRAPPPPPHPRANGTAAVGLVGRRGLSRQCTRRYLSRSESGFIGARCSGD